jgi:hypothetical protein
MKDHPKKLIRKECKIASAFKVLINEWVVQETSEALVAHVNPNLAAHQAGRAEALRELLSDIQHIQEENEKID